MNTFIKTFVLVFITFLCFKAKSQIDLKINPIGALFNSPDISGEYLITDNIGVEAKIGLVYGKITQLGLDYKRGGFSITPNARYYFSPEKGIDKFYAGLYTKFSNISQKFGEEGSTLFSDFSNTRFAVGLMLGYKFVADSGFSLDINFGTGRAFVNNYSSDTLNDLSLEAFEIVNLDFIGTIAIGWRILQ